MMRKHIAAMLSVLIAIQFIPWYAYAETNQDDEGDHDDVPTVSADEEQKIIEETDFEMLCEEPSLRGEDTKHFLNSDGSRTAVSYSYPVHYKNEGNGTWEDIDNRLIEKAVNDVREELKGSDMRNKLKMSVATETDKVYVPKSLPMEIALAGNTGSNYLVSMTSDGHFISWSYGAMEILRRGFGVISQKMLR